MKVILLQDIRGKGKKGQLIEASDGYARNYLLPRKLAVEATADNINTMKMNDKAKAERQAQDKARPGGRRKAQGPHREHHRQSRAPADVSSAPSPLPRWPRS